MTVRKETWHKKDNDGNPVASTGYRVEFYLELPSGKVEHVRKASTSWTRREAERWEQQKRVELMNPKPKMIDAPIVSEFFREWLTTDCVARGNRASTITEKQGDYDRYIGPLVGTLKLDEINFRVLTTFQAKLLKKLTPKSARNTAGTLRRMLVYAAKVGIIPGVPEFPELKVPRTSKFDFFNREEVEQLLAPVTTPLDRAELLVAFDTGIRTGEQVALRWGDANFQKSDAFPHGWLSIHKASSRGVIVGTKSGEVRKVPLTARCAAALKEIRGLRHLADTLIFPDRDDATKVEDVRQPDRRFQRACVKAGLRKMRRYGARHSFASNHVALGTPLFQVSKWMGHSTVGITASTYSHLAPIDGARWLAAFEAPTSTAQPPTYRQPGTATS